MVKQINIQAFFVNKNLLKKQKQLVYFIHNAKEIYQENYQNI